MIDPAVETLLAEPDRGRTPGQGTLAMNPKVASP